MRGTVTARIAALAPWSVFADTPLVHVGSHRRVHLHDRLSRHFELVDGFAAFTFDEVIGRRVATMGAAPTPSLQGRDDGRQMTMPLQRPRESLASGRDLPREQNGGLASAEALAALLGPRCG